MRTLSYETADFRFNKLRVEACVYLINEKKLPFLYNVKHAEHQAEERLCAVRLLRFEVERYGRIASVVGLEAAFLLTNVDDVAVGSTEHVE